MKYTMHCQRTISESIEIEADSVAEARQKFHDREDENMLCHSCTGNDFAGDDFKRDLDGELIPQYLTDADDSTVWMAKP